ncbi:hypothetical protein [Scytonema sp. PCC 10023]|uniref:hypothetical protein n=1 Tax=Scytonema sp. PCC 10023 TaxID=1680591 RepID=UPI0039C61EA3
MPRSQPQAGNASQEAEPPLQSGRAAMKKHPKFSCGMGVPTRPILRAGKMLTPQDR